MNETYRDGIGATRCQSCGSVILDNAEEPMVSVRLADVEEVAWLLTDMLTQFDIEPEQGWKDLIGRLEHAAGRPVAQMGRDR